MFDHLFSPLKIGKTELKNRISFLAHRTNFSENRRLSEQHLRYYLRRAQGGCGLIILGETSIDPADVPLFFVSIGRTRSQRGF